MGDVEARRTARRRKILENSENRLKKITGVESRTTKIELDGIDFHPSNEEFDIQTTSLPNLDSYKNIIEGNGDKILHESHLDDKNLETIFQNSRISLDVDSSVSHIPASQISSSRHFYITVLPVIMNLLLTLCDIFHIEKDFLYLNKIFMPLLAFEIYEYIFTPNIQFSNSIISSVILLSNRPYSRKLNFFVRYFLRTVQDVMIYFFVYLISQLFVKMIFFKF